MATLKVYRDFYVINSNNSSNSETYNLIDPFNLSVNVKKEGENNIIESPELVRESLGRYFINLNPILYSIDYNYEVNWNVIYVNNSPLKKLITRFKLHPITVGDNIELILDINDIRLDIDSNEIRIEI
jgi:hypothetical protein